MTYYRDEAFPALSDEQWARMQAYGSAQEVESGALLFGAGEATHDLILVDSGEAEVVRAATARAAEAVVADFGTGQFVGELGLLTGQATYLSGRVSKPGQVHRISPVSFRQLMDEGPDLSDVILRALMACRRNLRGGEAARSIEILGSEMSAGALALRIYAARQQPPHTWWSRRAYSILSAGCATGRPAEGFELARQLLACGRRPRVPDPHRPLGPRCRDHGERGALLPRPAGRGARAAACTWRSAGLSGDGARP